ncbi:AraC transcriptional regulator with GATase1 domain [Oleiphilus messinensis]|uniref:AraC transcriptional regulator with GATase1 domain n=1 Tax=Oleiphilus messinensis TaxID=141451 RepID=A0A1Y0I2P7_9GAMM|nr:helix-turn-helix domain-containing protein [Oleiphilus messinensis]ARU54742.1 AraC transcriptional regulator with GATase1 domain [Oleiphilus messinensis]
MTIPSNSAKSVAVIGFANAQVLDITGPMEVFSQANRVAMGQNQQGKVEPESRYNRYTIGLYSPDGEPFRVSNGLQLVPVGALADIGQNTHTLVIAGGQGTLAQMENPALIRWLQRAEGGFERIVSVCSGALLLAQAGLLTNRVATTHWSACQTLQSNFPETRVNENAIYTRDGKVYTSAGVTTGIDLCLALVAQDYGRAVAITIARSLVLYLQRPGGQRQFSRVLELQSRTSNHLEALVFWMAENLDRDLTVATLAEQACVSPRHLARKFQQEFGSSPMKLLAFLRLEKSRELLEESNLSIQIIATQCGFQSTETLRRQFNEQYGISPSQYRERFAFARDFG